MRRRSESTHGSAGGMGVLAADVAAIVGQLLVPVGAASLWRQVENVPQRLNRAGVARILSRIGRALSISELQKWRISPPSRRNTVSIGN